jgi:hypothetical protein
LVFPVSPHTTLAAGARSFVGPRAGELEQIQMLLGHGSVQTAKAALKVGLGDKAQAKSDGQPNNAGKSTAGAENCEKFLEDWGTVTAQSPTIAAAMAVPP